MVDILAALAASGCGVVLTIHQPRPDVFRLMHRVLLLSGRGQVLISCSSNRVHAGTIPHKMHVWSHRKCRHQVSTW